jgi:hypothetical protein
MNNLYRMHKTLRNSMEIAANSPPSILTCKSKNLLETFGNINAEQEFPGYEKDDCRFYRNAKCLFNLIVLHDPVIYKLIAEVQD